MCLLVSLLFCCPYTCSSVYICFTLIQLLTSMYNTICKLKPGHTIETLCFAKGVMFSTPHFCPVYYSSTCWFITICFLPWHYLKLPFFSEKKLGVLRNTPMGWLIIFWGVAIYFKPDAEFTVKENFKWWTLRYVTPPPPKFNSSPLRMDGWKTILSFLGR